MKLPGGARHRRAEAGKEWAMTRSVTCYRCNVEMTPQPESLDLSRGRGFGFLRDLSCDGPNAADTEFRGILVEVHRCPTCGGVATRPVTINLPERVRLAAAV